MTQARLALAAVLFAACAVLPGSMPEPQNADDLLIVDCLLPGQVKQLGRMASYVSSRRPVRTSALDCEVRGGEYVKFDRASYASALKVWIPQAESGDAKAQVMVGEIFEKGMGVPPDYDAAAQWYRRAAEQGDTTAQINLGHLYEQGLGVARDPATALRWYRKASGLDDAILLDPETLTNNREELAAARSEAARLRRELARARSEIESLQRKLQERAATVERKRETVAAARERVTVLRKQVPIGGTVDLAQAETTLASEEAALQRAQAEAAALQARIGQARAQAERFETRLDRSGSKPPAGVKAAALAPPSIEMIDPPLTATRGLRVGVRSATATRTLIGRLTAPAGLLSLKVNDAKARTNDHGVFTADVRLSAPRTPVRVEAVDRAGRVASVVFELERSVAANELQRRPAPIETRKTLSGVSFGRYHALVIGNDRYQHLPNLTTAVNDARSVASLLRDKYGFRTTLLENTTRYQLLSALNDVRSSLGPEDNLLIYYGGHGELDTENMRGYWLPVDAEEGNNANWVSNVSVTDMLRVIQAKQILLVVDACYSGSLTRSVLPRIPDGLSPDARRARISKLAEKRSRSVLTSGGLKPVMDTGQDGHSVFANSFVSVLEANDGVLEGHRLYREVAARVAYAAMSARFDQVPEYAPLLHAGHESGDFLLVPEN